jgi:hypothetical protein
MVSVASMLALFGHPPVKNSNREPRVEKGSNRLNDAVSIVYALTTFKVLRSQF